MNILLLHGDSTISVCWLLITKTFYLKLFDLAAMQLYYSFYHARNMSRHYLN